MARGQALVRIMGIRVDFCDPRAVRGKQGGYGNINGLPRQFLSQDADLPQHGPDRRDAIVDLLNKRPRRIAGLAYSLPEVQGVHAGHGAAENSDRSLIAYPPNLQWPPAAGDFYFGIEIAH